MLGKSCEVSVWNLREIPTESIRKSEKQDLADLGDVEKIDMSTDLGKKIALAKEMLSKVSVEADGEETWLKFCIGQQTSD